MLTGLFAVARPALFALPPEKAHETTLKCLELGFYPRQQTSDDPSLATTVAGLTMPNPVAVAAGFDKDARVPDALLQMGCGFAEAGTLTPLAQLGNPRPRVFRVTDHEALINRLGFNNGGHAAALERLRRRQAGGIVGVNLGANKDAPDRIADYVRGIEAFAPVASYFMINISSPNTPGLRDLQAPAALAVLLDRVTTARDTAPIRRPLFVKVSPDIAEADIAPTAECLLNHAVDAIAISNTTLARPGSLAASTTEAGGLSGRPLFEQSTAMLASIYRATGGGIPLIGIGGIDSAAAAVTKIRAGATLIQLYTGLVYKGPGLIAEIKRGLVAEVRRTGVTKLGDIVGLDAERWASRALA